MRITGRSLGIGLSTIGVAALLMTCGYLIGYWNTLGEGWTHSLSPEGLHALSRKIIAGFTVLAVAFAYIVHKLTRHATGHAVSPFGLTCLSLALLAAMYVATYDHLKLLDIYPFAGLLVMALLMFRMESRVVAAVVFGVVILVFYILGAKELGERDALRMQLDQSRASVFLHHTFI